jgi:uncharacterized protein (DUF2141 family)
MPRFSTRIIPILSRFGAKAALASQRRSGHRPIAVTTLALPNRAKPAYCPALSVRLSSEAADFGKKVMILPKWRHAQASMLGLLIALQGVFATASEAAPACIGPASDTWINITVDRVRNNKGLITATLYPNEPKRFLVKNGSLYVASAPAVATQTRFCLFVPRPGTYAVAIYHDEDSSGTINRGGLFGIPSEAVGFSNNPTIFLGPPSLRSTLVKVDHPNQSITINLKKF